MASTPPLSFAALAKLAANPAAGGYPYTLKGDDLDKCFTYATADFYDAHFKVTTGVGAVGHKSRKVELKVSIEEGTAVGQIAVWDGSSWSPSDAPPATGTHVFGVKDGTLQWIATEECE